MKNDCMKDETIKITITIPIPFDRPNKNGIMFTKEAVENAVTNIPVNMPILYKDNKDEYKDVVIGTTTGNSHIVTCDLKNQVYKMTVEGVLFNSGVEMFVNEIEGNKISDFRIVGIGLTK